MTGFLVASLLPPQAELEIIAVDPRVQRRGLARKLFDELIYQVGLAGVTEVVLEVRASNQPALALYRSLGFAETGRRRRYYADPEEDAVLMRMEAPVIAEGGGFQGETDREGYDSGIVVRVRAKIHSLLMTFTHYLPVTILQIARLRGNM